MALSRALCVSGLAFVAGQQAGTLKEEGNPKLSFSECTKSGGCTSQQTRLQLIKIGVGCTEQATQQIATKATNGIKAFAQIRKLAHKIARSDQRVPNTPAHTVSMRMGTN